MNHSDVFKLPYPVIKTLIQCVVLAGIVIVSVHPAQAQFTTSGSDIYNTNAGNVGIGTSTPGSKLDVNGWVAANGAFWAYGSNSAVYAADRTTSDWSAFYRSGGITALSDNTAGNVIAFDSTGKVGIGTSSPSAKLTVGASFSGTANSSTFTTNAGSLSSTANSDLLLGSIGFYSGNESHLGFHAYRTSTGAGWTTTSVGISMDVDNTPHVNNSGLWLGYQGNVGIGTTTPTSKLDVDGDITVSGNISAKYQDLAEWVPTDQVMSAGTVVVLDSKKRNAVLPSSKAYDTHVAGVVSDSPGIVLGVAAADKVKVATTGRVKVRVDASQGAIGVGDLLVTSDKEGMARKSDPLSLGGVEIHRPGTLIGKALEPLDAGEGEILVLLSLQ